MCECCEQDFALYSCLRSHNVNITGTWDKKVGQ